jgi:signal transduction histidine kinase
MSESFLSAVRDRRPADARRRGARFLLRAGRRTLLESLYLLTAPLTAAAGLLVVLAGVGLATVGLLLPGRSPVVARALTPARWLANLEWWRLAKVGSPLSSSAGPAAAASQRPRGSRGAAAADPGLWLDAAHAIVAVPVTLVTSLVTALWWFTGLAAATVAVRDELGPTAPMPVGKTVTGTAIGLVLLATLPLVTRACTAIQARLGQELLSDTSALHRRISGLEQERDTARAQTMAAVTAEATALRRLERDLHDGPQQRLVRLAMELGRAQHHFDTRPEAVRVALADAIVQTQEALEELRALSRGIAPPVLADRGLRAALTALAARSTVPAELDAEPLERRLDPAVETAAYFVIAEALTNVAKHSQARRCVVGLRHGAGSLRVWVWDDGAGGAALAKGHGLRGLDDRVLAAGGRLEVISPAGGPTTVAADLPCG